MDLRAATRPAVLQVEVVAAREVVAVRWAVVECRVLRREWEGARQPVWEAWAECPGLLQEWGAVRRGSLAQAQGLLVRRRAIQAVGTA